MDSQTCAICDERQTLQSADVCAVCTKDGEYTRENVVPNFGDSEPDWDEQHRRAQETGEVFEGERYGNR